MHYEEKIIDGVLYWSGGPREEFHPFSAATLTKMLIEERAKSVQYQQDSLQLAALREAIGNLVPDAKG